LKEEIEKLKMENQTLKTRHHDRISSNRSDENIKALEQELQKAKQINDRFKNAYTEVVREYEKAVAKRENLEQTVADDQLNRDKITREYESVKERMSALQNRYKAANDEKVKIEKELSESKSR
jgi:chromosome segregation ATPase